MGRYKLLIKLNRKCKRSAAASVNRGSQFKKEVRNDLFFHFKPLQFRLDGLF